MSTAWVRHEGWWQASADRVLTDSGSGTPGTPGTGVPMEAGAQLPIFYDPSSLPTTKWYISPIGSDTTGNGTAALPWKTLSKAIGAVTGPGQAIVCGDGTYAAETTSLVIASNKSGLLITAAAGENPVFDGSIGLGSATTEGSLRKFGYVQMPASFNASQVNLTSGGFPDATFDGSGNPTGLAAERGFANVTGATSYNIPASQVQAGTTSPRIIVGAYPDQVWVDDVRLKQVSSKSLVRQGYFWVDRDNANDGTTGRSTWLYLHQSDCGDMSKVRVSYQGGNDNAKGNFLYIDANNVTIRGIRIIRMSPSMAYFPISIADVYGVKLEDVSIEDCSEVAISVVGGVGSGFSGDALNKNTLLRRVTVLNAGWMGLSAMYTDDLKVTACLFENTNHLNEFDASPKSGAIKTSRTHRTVVEHSVFKNTGGHSVWLDQSNYDCTIASSYFENCSGSHFFWEISHRVLVVNNIFVRNVDTGISIRLSGGSGGWLLNNTIVGGSSPLYVVAEERGKYYTGSRPLSEHAERYGAGDYNADSGIGYSSDLDKARPGEYHATLPNVTPGMEWMARAEAIVNNVIAHYSTASTTEVMALYIRARTGQTAINVPARNVIPLTDKLFDGNIYQVQGSRMAQVDVRAPNTGGTTVLSNLSSWRGTSGLKNAGLFGSSGTPEAHGLEGKGPSGLGWVTRIGKPTADLDLVQGAAAPLVTTDTAMLDRIKAYIDPNARRYGSNLIPPGGWA